MGAAADFLLRVVRSQTLDASSPEMSALSNEYELVRRLLRESFASPGPDVQMAGSLAKGTAIRAGYDLDVVAYFANGDDTAGATLEDIYERVTKTLATTYRTRDRRSSIRLTARLSGVMPFTVDLVPGRFVDATRSDVFLHQTAGTKARLKTNLTSQIDHVRGSAVRDAIRLAKLWKLRAGLEVRTFVLELLCIEALEGHEALPLDEQMERLWTALRDDIDQLVVRDPANPSGNDLSELLDEVAEELTSGATVALDLVRDGAWTTIFGEDSTTEDRRVISSSALLSLGDTSHAEAAPWPLRRGTGSVKIVGSMRRKFRWRSPEKWRALDADGPPLLENSSLRFHAHVQNVPEPYEVKWHVVNTGAHAAEAQMLRGDQFFRGRAADDHKRDSEDPHINYERAEYTGKHWVECIIVKNGEVWARSGPFFVNVINRSRATRWFLR